MSGNLLNNDNKTNYLFKKENYVIQSTLTGFGDTSIPVRTFAGEIYGSKSIVFNENIFSTDISKNIPPEVQCANLFNGPIESGIATVPDISGAEWISDISNQVIYPYNLGNFNSVLSYLTFYKRVYLEPVDPASACPSTWWVKQDVTKDAGPDNNLLSNMIPAGIGKNGSIFTPIVEFYNPNASPGSEWTNEPGATFLPTTQDSANWSIDYATGILTLNVSKDHLDAINYDLDADPNKSGIETCRPRISFIKYSGNFGGGGGSSGGGSGGSGGGISDASYNELKDDITEVNEKLEEYLFNLPPAITDFSYNEVIDGNGIPHAILTWTNPSQKCAAFDFYQIDESGIGLRDQTYKPDNSNGIWSVDTGIWDTIKRSMNKLPFHERIHLQYQQYDPNQNFAITSVDINNNPIWADLGGAQVVDSTGIDSTSNSGQTLYPIFKDIIRADIFTDGTLTLQPNLTNGVTRQDIENGSTTSYLSTSKKTYTNKNTLDSSKVYKFRIALDNKACINGNNNNDDPTRDISNNLNWAVVPKTGYIELGSYGPAPAPSNIQFVTGEKAFDNSGNSPFAGTITGTAGASSSSTGPVMDISFNTAFSPSAPLTVYYGFRISGSQLSTSKQLGSSKTSNLALQYANENSFTYSDLSYNTPGYNISNSDGIKTSTFSIDCDIIQNGWEPSTTSNFLTNFPNGIALPERIYDISSVYMMNDKKDYLPGVKSFADYSVYGGNFPSTSTFASPEQTSSAIFGVNDYMNPLENEVIDSSANSVTPGFKITLSNPPTGVDYSSTDELKEVRTEDHKKRYAIFLASNSTLNLGFKGDDFTSQPSGFSNVNFVTCPQKLGTSVIVGEDISSNTIATYDMTFDYYNSSGPVSDNINVSIDGYDKTQSSFPYTETASNTNSSILTTVSIQNEDPTGTVPVGGPSRLQEQFGGYYNIQKVMSQTEITGITLNDIIGVANSANPNKYETYSFKLEQTLDLFSVGGTIKNKTIKFLLGEAPTFDITVPIPLGTPLGIPSNGILTDTKLFGIRMPSNKLLFRIPNFTVNDINTDWIWPSPEKLFKLDFIYRHDRTSPTADVTLDLQEEDWRNPVVTPQTETWSIEEVLNSSSPLVTTYKYSRNGVEDGTTGSAQFEINIRCKNNIYSTATPSFPKHFDVLYLSNDSNAWNWGGNDILWWDYTYNSTSISNGDLPENFITISNTRPGSKGVTSTMQLQDTSVSATYNNPTGSTPTSGSYYLLGGPHPTGSVATTNHEWYDTDYDHSSTSTNNNQLLWSNSSFKCGGTAPSSGTLTKDTNILNPYINYSSIYFANSGTQPDYSGKLSVGESWDYTLKSGENINIPPSAQRYQGTYKWILIKLTWDDSGSYNAADNPWNGMNGNSQVEIYVSESGTASKTNRLTLGTDYLMWLCAVGNGINPNTQFKDNGGTGNTRTRCGWLDCQRKKPSSQSYTDGEGCRDANAFTNSQEYKFQIPTITNNGSTNRVTDIFIRVGIPNNTNALTSGDAYYSNKKIANISVKLNA